LYVSKPEHPEYVRQTLRADPKRAGRLFRDITFAIRAHLIDDIYLERVKEIARRDTHLAQHIQASVTELQQKHTEAIISVDEHLAQVCKEQEKTLALLHDQILDLTPVEKAKYKAMLEGLREREKELLAVQE